METVGLSVVQIFKLEENLIKNRGWYNKKKWMSKYFFYHSRIKKIKNI